MSCLKAAVVGIHLMSAHSGSGYNNTNPGAYIKSCGIQTGAYYNSLHRMSIYSGRVFELDNMFLITGVATGYSKTVTPFLSAGFKIHKYNVWYTPKFKGLNKTHLVHISLEF